jgi:hypothetical protein
MDWILEEYMTFLCQRFRHTFVNCRHGFLFLALLVSLHFFTGIAQAEIKHLELGAANYGHSAYSSKRFLVLEQTLRDLVEQYGPHGKIYLNDINEYGLGLAVEFTRIWLKKNGYYDISVIALPGDYTLLNLPLVTSAHLTNPEWSQLPNPKNGPAANQRIVKNLERIASASTTGLMITTYYFGAIQMAAEFLQHSSVERTGRTGHYYYFPDGSDPRTTFSGSWNTEFQPKVFILKVRASACTAAHAV